MGEHLMKHGDGVRDIAFQVEDCDFLIKVTMMHTSVIKCSVDVLMDVITVWHTLQEERQNEHVSYYYYQLYTVLFFCF